MYLVGIDPGLAKIGLALVHHNGTRTLKSIALVETDKEAATRKMAVNADDNRRFHDIHQQVDRFLAQIPQGERVLVGIEGFGWTPGSGRNLLKTAQAVGVIKGALYARGKIPFEFKPSEVRQTILGTKSGSKEDLQTVLEQRYPNLPKLLEDYAKGKWEHMTDAVALAECAYEEYAQRKLYLGGIEA